MRKKTNRPFTSVPCFSESSVSTSLTLHKDTYLFVTPTFIKEYAGDLESAETDLAYAEFVDYLQALVTAKPIITALEKAPGGDEAGTELTINGNYVLVGAYLNNQAKVIASGAKKDEFRVQVGWVDGNDKMVGAPLHIGEVQANTIFFSVPAAQKEAYPVGVFFTDDKGEKPTLAVASPLAYTAVPSSGGN